MLFLAFVGVLMAFGIDAALPAFDEIRDDFDLADRGISPAVTGTAYFVGMAAGQLFAGVLSDRFGRQRVLLGSIGLYALGALGSVLAPTFEVLLAARLVWGVGAAGPAVLRLAISRDLFSGDRMARVVSLVSAVFLLGPIFVPIVGEGILLVGSWRVVFASALVLAALAGVWTIRFGETLPADRRRPMDLGALVEGGRLVLRTRVTLAIMVGQSVFGAAFFVWLGSAQPILDEIYGRDDQFTLFFGASGLAMVAALLVNNRLIRRFGTRRVVLVASIAFVCAGVAGLAVVSAADGVPSVWTWFAWAVVANMLSMVMGPMSVSLALEPMGDQAGTASALLGLAQFGVGALLAAVVDSAIDDTVTPMLVGSVVYGSIGLVSLIVALTGRPPATRAGASRAGACRDAGARDAGDAQPISSGISDLRRAT